MFFVHKESTVLDGFVLVNRLSQAIIGYLSTHYLFAVKLLDREFVIKSLELFAVHSLVTGENREK